MRKEEEDGGHVRIRNAQARKKWRPAKTDSDWEPNAKLHMGYMRKNRPHRVGADVVLAGWLLNEGQARCCLKHVLRSCAGHLIFFFDKQNMWWRGLSGLGCWPREEAVLGRLQGQDPELGTPPLMPLSTPIVHWLL